jgi:hypothetical protein
MNWGKAKSEVAVALLRYYPDIFLEEMSKIVKYLREAIRSSGRNLKPGPFVSKVEALPFDHNAVSLLQSVK